MEPLSRYNFDEILYGCLFFIFHICIEIISYTLLYIKFSTYVAVFIVILYDFFAFFPQVIIAEFHNSHKKINIGLIGVFLFVLSILLVKSNNDTFYILSMFFLAIGNAFLHESGAIAVAFMTTKNIFPSALFVSGGSFGIIIGIYMGKLQIPLFWLSIPLIIITLILLLTQREWCKEKNYHYKFDIVNKKIEPINIIIISFIVIAVRSYIGFTIPMYWKEDYWQTVLLFCSLGLGKAVGGYLSDCYGYKKISMVSTLLCIPFIIIGQWHMIFSLIGMLLFSMTMSITYAMLLNVIKDNAGVAFGITTIALFVGFLPAYLFKLDSYINIIFVIIFSIISYYLLNKVFY